MITGHNGISARLLRTSADAIATSLTSIFNFRLQSGEFPQDWKHANVTPVPKAGDKHSVKKYQLVSVIPVVAKCLNPLCILSFMNT